VKGRLDSDRLTQEIKALARQYGAALVGVASIDRFDPVPPLSDRPPRGHHPRDFVPNARSVISIAQPVLNAVLNAPAALADVDIEMVPPDIKYPYLELLYNTVGHRVQDYMLEQIGHVMGQYLLAHGYDAMIFPTTGLHPRPDPPLDLGDRQIWEGPSQRWAELHSPFRYTFGPFSHRHAATRAGLGEFGYNNVVLTPEYGPRQRFNSIVTDAELVPDPLVTRPICLREACNLCLKACIVDAITMRDHPSVLDYRSVETVDRSRIFIDTPAKTDPTICTRRRERIPNSPIRGDCIRICPVPAEPTHLPRRLKEIRGH
jgi:epoxyqueuosine reductase QueG